MAKGSSDIWQADDLANSK